jgi:hypothetical protein
MVSTRIYFFKLTAISAAIASAISVSITAHAQTSAIPTSTPAPQKVEGVVVIGNPLDARDVVAAHSAKR